MEARLNDGIRRSQEFLLSIQKPDGFWIGELESNVTTVAEAVLLHKVFEKNLEPAHKVEKFVRSRQRDQGGWELFYGDGGNLSVSVEAYMILRLLNVEATDPALQNACRFIVGHGGISQCVIFTKIKLALLGCFDWSGIPSIPPWIMLLPDWFPFTVYDMANWARNCTVPLTIVFDRKPILHTHPPLCLDELYSEGRSNARCGLPYKRTWADIFNYIDHACKFLEKYNMMPLRKKGIKAAEKWVLERMNLSGHWGGALFTTFSMIGLRALNYEASEPIIEAAFEAWRKTFAIETDDELRVQQYKSVMWDTGNAVKSLVESGLNPDHPAIQKGSEFLLQQRSVHRGDWAVRNKQGVPGGWGFQFESQLCPDVDDSAVIVMALLPINLPDCKVSKNSAISRAVGWIHSMQCKTGGWGAFDVDNDQSWMNHTPYGDMEAMIDPNTSDVTARVLEMAGRMEHYGMPLLPSSSLQKAVAYLVHEQEPEGCWFGRWGVNYIYGTSGALLALSLVSPHAHLKEIAKGAAWLVQCQTKSMDNDGGWGETCFSYSDPSLKGVGEHSTPSQTAWAILGLLAAGDALGTYEYQVIDKGIQYLLNNQHTSGSWEEPYFTGTGFPKHYFLKYHLYPQYFPLSALGAYRKHLLERCV